MTTETHTIDFGSLGEIDVVVEFDYQPEERPVLGGLPENCHPGCSAELTINQVTCNGVDITALADWTFLEDRMLEDDTRGEPDYDEDFFEDRDLP